jgi:hypothetical protein
LILNVSPPKPPPTPPKPAKCKDWNTLLGFI